jgi:VanZ family protein
MTAIGCAQTRGRSRAADPPWRPTLFRAAQIGYAAKMFRIATAAAAWISLAFIAYATLSPLNERPELDFDLISHPEHYLAFALAGSLFALAYPRQMSLVCILVLGSAIVLELLQLLTPDRHARLIDAIRKIIGGALGLGFARVAWWNIRKSRCPSCRNRG